MANPSCLMTCHLPVLGDKVSQFLRNCTDLVVDKALLYLILPLLNQLSAGEIVPTGKSLIVLFKW